MDQRHLLFFPLLWLLAASSCSSPAENPAPERTQAGAEGAAGQTADTPDYASQPDAALEAPPSKPAEAFIDVTASSGIVFSHFNGTTGDFLLPEITGSGGALFDYDNDGDLDLYLVQGAPLKPGSSPPGFAWSGETPPQDRLFRNDSRTGPEGAVVRFTDVTSRSGIKGFGYGMGVATGDIDNDGWVDLYVTNLGSNQLLRNNRDGTFVDITKSSGADDPRWSTSAAFLDYDRDGLLDLYIANYVDFSVGLKRECFAKTSARDYCGPDAYDASPDRLLRNRGDGKFEDVTAALGIDKAFGAALGVIASDLNGDGWVDIYVANDGDPNILWINPQGKGPFQDEALLAGVALNQAGWAEAGMGVDAADINADGAEDLFLAHLDGESNTLYVTTGKGYFEDQTVKYGLHGPSLPFTGFGTGFLDFDNDGRLDLIVMNGAVRLQERQARAGEPYPLQQRNLLFRREPGGFVEVTAKAGDAMKIEEVSRGAVFGDVDNDGDTDVVITNNNGPARLLLSQAAGVAGNWLGLRVIGKHGRDAHHAWVEVETPDGSIFSRRVRTEGSYCSARDPRVLVGLGERDAVKAVRVKWPAGAIEQWRDLPLNRYSTLREGASTGGS